MAGRIAGITIKLGADSSEFQKTIKGMDKSLRQTQSSLRDVNKLLKFNPGNTELLTQKQRGLKKAVDETRARLIELRKASENVTPADIGQDKYDALQREIIETESKLKNLEKQYRDFGSVATQKIALVGEKMQAFGNGMKAVGKNLTQYVTLPLVAAFAASAKSAIDWETDFTGVMKTVDETATTSYENIADGIKKMSTRTASTKGDITKVAEVAGQLGISADDLVAFTETMVQLGDTTNLSAEDAATSLARFMNITGESSDHADRLGSAIVELGNNFATDEASIVNMSTRLAAAGRIAGLSSQDILALAASMSSVGIEAEAGGTAMSQTLTTISQAVAGGGEELERFAQVAGMSSDEFAKKWKSEPIKAVQAFIGGLGKLNAEGEDTYGILDELGMSGIRQSNMLQSLALASDVLTDATKRSSDAYEENSALQDEASKRYETMAAKLSQTKQQFENVAIEIGERLLPYIDQFLGFLDRLVQKWDELSPVEQDMIVKAGLIVAALGPVLSILGQIIFVVGSIMKAAPILGAAVAGLAGPGTLIIGIIAAVIAIGVLLGQHWDEVCAWANNLKEKVSGAISEMKQRVSDSIEGVKAKFSDMKDKVSNIMNMVKTDISNKIEAAKAKVTSVVNAMKSGVTNTISGMKSAISSTFDSIKSGITSKINAAKDAVSNAMSAIRGLLSGSISFPHITLPHFTVTGSPPFGLGGKGSPPHISVEWYAKAMKQPYVLDGATIFGMMGNKFLGGGERGKEVIMRYDTFRNMGGDVNINMVVNAAPGMDETALANMVARKINKQVRELGAVW